MENFKNLVKAHWKKYYPGMVREMKKEGTYEKMVNEEARRMSEELAAMVSGGAQIAAAMEIIYKEYLSEPEETTE
jgi:hypothetical protein